MDPVQWRKGELIEAEPFPGEVRNENLLLLRPTLDEKKRSSWEQGTLKIKRKASVRYRTE